MKPFLSILLALIITILLFIGEVGLIMALNTNLGSLTVFIFILGGGIATWFAAGKKVRYSIYYGLISALIALVLGNYIVLILIPILAGIGGFLGKMADKNSRQTFNGYHPILAIIAGIIILSIYNGFLGSITGAYTDNLSSFGLNEFVIGIIALAVGGFTTTFLSKGKKIQYGIYVGLIVVIISSSVKLYVTHTINIHENYLVLIGAIAGYLLAAALGSFAAKKVGEIDNKNLKIIPLTGIISIVLVMALIYGVISTGGFVSGSGSSEGVAMGSGSSEVMSNFATEIEPDNTPTITDLRNGSYEVSGLLNNNANKSYNKVKILVTGYDVNGTEIVENKGLITEIKANSNSHYDVILTPATDKAVDSAYVVVFNSTAT